jgi:Predicted membrane protein (DUF2157)
MDVHLFEALQQEELVTAEAVEQVKSREQTRLVSVQWDLRTLLYLSILLFVGGVSIFIYKHIDTIGHVAVLALIGIIAAVCMVYCSRLAAPYSHQQVPSPNVWFDYVLLLGCLLTLTFVGYLQFQYKVFGTEWGMATFIPMVFLFICAYYFDHVGVLCLAISNLGAWMGISVTPLKLLHGSFFGSENLVINGVMLGVLLHAFSWLSKKYSVKAHFANVYKNFGVHVLFISLIGCIGLFWHWYFVWLMVLIAVVGYQLWVAFARRSFYYIVVSVLYGYVGLSYVTVRLLINMAWHNYGDTPVYLICFYFIGSGLGLVFLLMRINKILKAHDSVQ